MIEADIIISGGTYLILDDKDTILRDGALAVAGNKIIACGSRKEITENYRSREVIEATDCLIMPGLVNGHTHAAMTCFRGMADDLPLMEWLNNYIFPAEAKNVNPELVYWGTMLACAEMIKSGTTTFSDMYLFEDEAAQAAKQAGMRCLLGEGLFDFPSPNAKSPEEGLKYTEKFINRWAGDPLVGVMVVPHSLYTCSRELLCSARDLARQYGAPIGIHLLENEAERQLIIAKTGERALSYLKKLDLLQEDLFAYHCVSFDAEDIRIFADHGCRISHHPESNMKLASGVAPVVEMLKAGIKVGLGTDGCASNNNLDMFQEMDTAAKLHKVAHLDPTVMNAATVLKMASINGALALGLKNVGSLEAGMKADLIIIDLMKPHLTPLYSEYSHLVYAVEGADVETMLIDGRIVMRNRVLLTINETETIDRVKALAGRIRETIAC